MDIANLAPDIRKQYDWYLNSLHSDASYAEQVKFEAKEMATEMATEMVTEVLYTRLEEIVIKLFPNKNKKTTTILTKKRCLTQFLKYLRLTMKP